MRSHKSNNGFTLVELIVAMVVMAILSSVAVASYRSFTLEARRGRGQMPPYLSRGKVRLYRYVDVMEWFESDALLSVYETKSKRITADLLK